MSDIRAKRNTTGYVENMLLSCLVKRELGRKWGDGVKRDCKVTIKSVFLKPLNAVLKIQLLYDFPNIIFYKFGRPN